ncbi:MAG: hypothetical protein JWP15_3554 [Alphaproteobacteria bacterium]|nr:hypothetical protein [Alphaproteobacteria bacterium]
MTATLRSIGAAATIMPRAIGTVATTATMPGTIATIAARRRAMTARHAAMTVPRQHIAADPATSAAIRASAPM